MAGTRKYGASATVATNAIGGLQGVSFSGRGAEVIEVTEHRTGVDALKNLREKMGGLVDSGQVTFTANYIKNDVGQEKLRSDVGLSVAFLVTFSDGATVAGTGVISEASPPSPDGTEGAMEVSGTIDITGTLTFSES